MRHDARHGTAIGLLDLIFAGEAAEKVLTNWARTNRYAGSKDRAAVRDIVFDALRGRNTYQVLAQATGGRAAVLGQLAAGGHDVDAVFTGDVHAPDALTSAERAVLAEVDASRLPIYDVPDWLLGELRRSLADDFDRTMAALRDRAPVDLRVNLLKTDVSGAATALSGDGVQTEPLRLSPHGLRVTEGERRVALSAAYTGGLVELQDAGSQAVVEALPLQDAPSVLDYCAGGGGKSLAIASLTRGKAQITAYDKSHSRLKNLTVRAERAGVAIAVADTDPAKGGATYDLVLLDVPCSGSGAWRRNPDAKWKFTAADLSALNETQDGILDAAAGRERSGGTLAYVTCSLLCAENEDRIAAFLLRRPGWTVQAQYRFPLGPDSDGFFLCLMTQSGG